MRVPAASRVCRTCAKFTRQVCCREPAEGVVPLSLPGSGTPSKTGVLAEAGPGQPQCGNPPHPPRAGSMHWREPRWSGGPKGAVRVARATGRRGCLPDPNAKNANDTAGNRCERCVIGQARARGLPGAGGIPEPDEGSVAPDFPRATQFSGGAKGPAATALPARRSQANSRTGCRLRRDVRPQAGCEGQ